MESSSLTEPLLHGDGDGSDVEDESSGEIPYEDECNIETKGSVPLFQGGEPVDRYNVAFFIFYLLGMTTLLPWNFFITADDYWMYKLRNVTGNQANTNVTRTTMQAEFMAYLSIASTSTNTLFLILNTLLSHKISLQTRVVGSLGSIVVLFIGTTVLVKVDTDSWQEYFFILTLTTVVLLNVASAILGGSLFGIVGQFPSRYISAMVSGQALGGIVSALAEIASLWLGASSTTSAFVYFMAANLMLIATLVSYIVLSKSMFFKYYVYIKGNTVTSIQGRLVELVAPAQEIRYLVILKKIWVYAFSVLMTFMVSLSVYPSVTVLVNSMHKGNGRPWNDIYFVPVVGYLLFSTFDYIGRILAGIVQRPKKKGWLLALLSILRIVFIPLILLSNAQPRRHLPVVVDNDMYYILIVIVFSLVNGYLANITMLSVPKVVCDFEQEIASSMMAAFLGIGLALGSAISIMLVKVL